MGYGNSNVMQGSQVSQTSYYSSNYSSNKNINLQNAPLRSSNVGYSSSGYIMSLLRISSKQNLTLVARKRLDVARRLFKMFDKDGNG